MRAVNLIPAEQRGSTTGGGRSEGGAYAVLGVLGGLVILALLYGSARHDLSSRQSQLASLTARAQAAQARASQLATYTNFVQLSEQRAKDVAELVDSRFDWGHALHELGRVLPSGVSVTSLTGTIGPAGGNPGSPSSSSSSSSSSGSSANVTSATPAGSVPTFILDGCATSQAQVALTLNRLHLVDGVSEVVLQSSIKASPGSGSGSNVGGCAGSDPQFSVQISFVPMPTPSGSSAVALRSVADGGAR